MDNIPTDGREKRNEFAVTINNDVKEDQCAPPFLTSTPRPQQLHNSQEILHLLYVGAIVAMYPSMAQLAQLKFQNKPSPFETHTFLSYVAVVAYTIAIPSSILSFYMRARLKSALKERFYIILKGVFCFSGILSPLSLVLVLLVPQRFNWIGYPIIFALFVIIVVCNFGDYIKCYFQRKMYRTWEQFKVKIEKLFSRNDDVSKLGAVQRDEKSPESIVTICDD